MEGFRECFSGVDDPRSGNARRHDLQELLVIALCTVLCGGESCVDMADFAEEKEPFLREFLSLDNGLPSHDTFSRVFRALEPEQFRRCFQDFMGRFAATCQGVIAIDGKVLRRSFDTASAKSSLHMVSAWGCEQRLVLGQIATDAKSNEITAVPKLLEMLSLKGCIVSVDALNCQREIARQIVDQGGDYALALKGNQGTLHDDVRMFLDDPATPAITTDTTVDGDHGRIETRTSTISTAVDWLQEDHRWPGLKSDRKNRANPRDRGQDNHGNGLLPPQHANDSRALRPGRPGALGGRKQPPLDARCHHERGSGQEPARSWAQQPRRPPSHGTQHPQRPEIQDLQPTQNQTSRMEQRIPCQPARSNLKCDSPGKRRLIIPVEEMASFLRCVARGDPF